MDVRSICNKCDQPCEMTENFLSMWTAAYGFPHYKKIGWIFKKTVPNGWEDGGLKIEVHKICNTALRVGRENRNFFCFCPKCLVKVK